MVTEQTQPQICCVPIYFMDNFKTRLEDCMRLGGRNFSDVIVKINYLCKVALLYICYVRYVVEREYILEK